MAELRDGVALTELGVITRWSLAVRQPEAERAELIAELRADLAWLERAPSRETAAPVRRLRKKAPGSPAAEAPAETAPEKTTKGRAPSKQALDKATPGKTAATKTAPGKAVSGQPRRRRPASGE